MKRIVTLVRESSGIYLLFYLGKTKAKQKVYGLTPRFYFGGQAILVRY